MFIRRILLSVLWTASFYLMGSPVEEVVESKAKVAAVKKQQDEADKNKDTDSDSDNTKKISNYNSFPTIIACPPWPTTEFKKYSVFNSSSKALRNHLIGMINSPSVTSITCGNIIIKDESNKTQNLFKILSSAKTQSHKKSMGKLDIDDQAPLIDVSNDEKTHDNFSEHLQDDKNTDISQCALSKEKRLEQLKLIISDPNYIKQINPFYAHNKKSGYNINCSLCAPLCVHLIVYGNMEKYVYGACPAYCKDDKFFDSYNEDEYEDMYKVKTIQLYIKIMGKDFLNEKIKVRKIKTINNNLKKEDATTVYIVVGYAINDYHDTWIAFHLDNKLYHISPKTGAIVDEFKIFMNYAYYPVR